MDIINFKNELNNVLSKIDKNNKPNLFLHVCCAPCSSYVLKFLNEYFNIYIIFYNPNIDTENEFDKRLKECYRLIDLKKYSMDIIFDKYNHNEFLDYITGYENEPEGGKRCHKCFELRLKHTYDIAYDYIIKNNMLDKENYFTTTLTISPHKDANLIYNIAKSIEKDNLKYLASDFKKNNGYLESINISKELDLYRQNYCGCEFSKYIK